MDMRIVIQKFPRPENRPMEDPDLRLPGLRSAPLSSLSTSVQRSTQRTPAMCAGKLSYEFVLGIGEHVNRQLLKKYEQEKEQAIKALGERIWREAEVIRDGAVAAAVGKMIVEHQKALKRQQRSHERALKEEIVKVTGIMQKQSMEQLQLERAIAEKSHKTTIEMETSICVQKQQSAIEDARIFEQNVEDVTTSRLKEDLEKEIMEEVARLHKEKENALMSEADRWSSRLKDMTCVHSDKEDVLRQRVEEMRHYLSERKNAFNEVAELDRAIAEQQKNLSEVLSRKQREYQRLLECKREFQKSIDEHQQFDPHQTGYLIPSLSNVNLESFELRTCSEPVAPPCTPIDEIV